MFAEMTSKTASGSNTNTKVNMTTLTASSMIVDELSPYMSSAMYLIGPTSDSSLFCSVCNAYFFFVRLAISFVEVVICELSSFLSPS